MKRRGKLWRWVLAGAVVVAANAALWLYLRPGTTQPLVPADYDAYAAPAPTLPDEAPQPAPASAPAQQPHRAGETTPAEIFVPAPARAPHSQPPLGGEEAHAAYRRGLELVKAGNLLAARTELNSLYYAEALPSDAQANLRQTLSELAEVMIIGRSSPVFDGDPYTFHYEIQPGEVLTRVERKLELRVPWQLLLHVNGLSRGEDIQAGRMYKMVRGAFHAVVYKSDFTMDIYLQREGQQRVFIRRMPVGTGLNGSTPAGMWRVRLGGKEQRPTWYPPPNSPLRGPITYGSPDYAFGAKGLWISLEGLDERTRPLTDYGLHSTNDPASIGQAVSLGCIRLGDDDIELAFRLLYEHWSTVEVRP